MSASFMISTCQLTDRSCALIEQLVNEKQESNVPRNANVQVVPQFNIAKRPKTWVNLEEYNVPTFGPNVASAVVRLLASVPELATLYRKYGAFKPITMDFDDFAISKKADEVGFVIQYLRGLSTVEKGAEFAQGVDEAAINLTAFIENAKALYAKQKKNISATQWCEMLSELKIADDFRNRLHFNKVVGLFTSNQDVVDTLASSRLPDGKFFNETSTRWISNMIYPFRPSGPLCDIVNMVFAVMGEAVPANVDGVDFFVTNMIDTFTRSLVEFGNQSPLIKRSFDTIVLDGEIDDMLSLALLEYLFGQIKVFVQLPTKGKVIKKVKAVDYADEYKEHDGVKVEKYEEKGVPMLKISWMADLPSGILDKMAYEMVKHGFEHFFDPQSANYSKIVEFWPRLGLTEM
jgi:hypothetical protein